MHDLVSDHIGSIHWWMGLFKKHLAHDLSGYIWIYVCIDWWYEWQLKANFGSLRKHNKHCYVTHDLRYYTAPLMTDKLANECTIGFSQENWLKDIQGIFMAYCATSRVSTTKSPCQVTPKETKLLAPQCHQRAVPSEVEGGCRSASTGRIGSASSGDGSPVRKTKKVAAGPEPNACDPCSKQKKPWDMKIRGPSHWLDWIHGQEPGTRLGIPKSSSLRSHFYAPAFQQKSSVCGIPLVLSPSP